MSQLGKRCVHIRHGKAPCGSLEQLGVEQDFLAHLFEQFPLQDNHSLLGGKDLLLEPL